MDFILKRINEWRIFFYDMSGFIGGAYLANYYNVFDQKMPLAATSAADKVCKIYLPLDVVVEMVGTLYYLITLKHKLKP